MDFPVAVEESEAREPQKAVQKQEQPGTARASQRRQLLDARLLGLFAAASFQLSDTRALLQEERTAPAEPVSHLEETWGLLPRRADAAGSQPFHTDRQPSAGGDTL